MVIVSVVRYPGYGGRGSEEEFGVVTDRFRLEDEDLESGAAGRHGDGSLGVRPGCCIAIARLGPWMLCKWFAMGGGLSDCVWVCACEGK